MKAINAILVSTCALALGACAITIDGEDRHYDYDDRADHMRVTLPNGDRDSFTCPEGTTAFVINKKDTGQGMAYGCRTEGTPMPTIGNE